MPPQLYDLFDFLGFVLRAVGFLVAGLAFSRVVLESIKGAVWQVRVCLLLGLFGLMIALTAFSTPGSAGAFALGAGTAYFWSPLPLKSSSQNEKTDQ
jgi:membrane protein DedA with SNARE-associated domain